METRPFINIEETWINILNLMKKSGITKKDLAKIFRISVQAVHQKFTPTSLPTLEQILIMSEIFEKPIEEILVIEQVEEDYEYVNIIKKAHENNRRNASLADFSNGIVGEEVKSYIVCKDVERYFNEFFSNDN